MRIVCGRDSYNRNARAEKSVPPDAPDSNKTDGSGGYTSGQGDYPAGGAGGTSTVSTASTATTGAGMTLATKIIIGVIAAAVVTAGAIIIPPLMETPPEETPPPAVTDTETPVPDGMGQTEPPDAEQSDMENGISYYNDDMLNGKRHGYGVWAYENYRYEGWWENDSPNGQGTLYENLEIDEALPTDMYDQIVEKAVTGNFIDGTIDDSVVDVWHLQSGNEHRFYFELESDHTNVQY